MISFLNLKFKKYCLKQVVKFISFNLISNEIILSTGKSFSEALILPSTNPQFDKILFIELRVQYMKTASSEHVMYINCSECQNKNIENFVYTTCSELVVFMY